VPNVPPDIQDLFGQLAAAERDAESLVAGLSEEDGVRRPPNGGWCVAECLDHLATANRVYLVPMREAASRARARGHHRRGPAQPGVIGSLFIWSLEPPPRWWYKVAAPRPIRPRVAPPLGDAFAGFLQSQSDVRAFLGENADLDLAGTRFVNPFVRGVRFSLATGLHVVTAHERRHLWQGWRVRRSF
jgi:DinB family protein